MFIRTKKIRKKGKEYRYAYHVENRWQKRKKASRQRVKGYLGKVILLEKTIELPFFRHYSVSDASLYVKNTSLEHIIRDLAAWELLQHGFEEKEGKLCRNDVVFEPDSLEVYQLNGKRKNPKIVLEMNEGFLCNATLKALLSFKTGRSEEETGYKLASLLTEAGIKIPEELFVEWVTRILGIKPDKED